MSDCKISIVQDKCLQKAPKERNVIEPNPIPNMYKSDSYKWDPTLSALVQRDLGKISNNIYFFILMVFRWLRMVMSSLLIDSLLQYFRPRITVVSSTMPVPWWVWTKRSCALFKYSSPQPRNPSSSSSFLS